MSAIGGCLCFGGKSADTELAMAMSRAMQNRGRNQRGAYCKKNGWLIHNRAMSDGGAPWDRQPLTVVRDGYEYTVVLDGRVWGRGDWRGLSSELTAESDAALVLSCYLAYGTSFAKYLSGSFALAILDERRGELILATDGAGSRPLFYLKQGESFLFASEIKGLLRALPWGAEVDREKLREHLMAPVGTWSGTDLYREIRAIPAGSCAVVSRMGVVIFSCEGEGEPPRAEEWQAVSSQTICQGKEELRQVLTEALFAFDYPQFDCFMPALLRRIEARRQTRLTVEDEMWCGDRGYARERADRLGQGRGKVISPVKPRSAEVREKELKRMEKYMKELLAEVDGRELTRLFGKDWREILAGEKNTAKRIRMEGILYQSILWKTHYPLLWEGGAT